MEQGAAATVGMCPWLNIKYSNKQTRLPSALRCSASLLPRSGRRRLNYDLRAPEFRIVGQSPVNR